MIARASQLFLPTLRDDPADAEVASHKLLVRGGFIRQVSAGIWTYTPLGWRVHQKVVQIIRDEMDAIGAQEMLAPVLTPAELWETSGRYDLPVNETNKPLYRYEGTPEIFHCPADRGDTAGTRFVGINCTNCYGQYGTSYLMEWAVDFMRTKRPFGDIAAPRNTYPGQSMKTSEVAVSPANKIFLGDWIWHYNRGWLNQRSVWHNYRGKSLVVMLFGDTHAEGYRFPTKPEGDPYWSAPPSSTNQWW